MKIDISPDMPMYNLLKSYPYSLAGALSEYIDNALQAYLDSSDEVKHKLKKLEIRISFDLKDKHSQKITVSDNGVGISSKDLQRAMKPGFAASEANLHEFGIGMKAASVWLGREWNVSSLPYGDEVKYCLRFDLDELLKNNQSTLEVDEQRKKPYEHGVLISISRLRDLSSEQVIAACHELFHTYQIFIFRDEVLDLKFSFDGTSEDLNISSLDLPPKELEYPTAYTTRPTWSDKTLAFKYGDVKTWKEDISFTFNGKKVTGFIMVRDEASQATNPGISLFRYKRLIQGTSLNPYRPKSLLGTSNKAAPSKIYMELHLDGQGIAHTKNKFSYDEERFLSALKSTKPVKDYLTQAEMHRPNYEDENQVEYFESLDDIKKSLKERKKSKQDKEDKRKQKGDDSKDKSNSDPKVMSPSDHNNNWLTLFPKVFQKTHSDKLNALIIEAELSELNFSPYSSCFLLRTILEKLTFEFLKKKNHLKDVINFNYEKQLESLARQGKDTGIAKKVMKPSLDHMFSWLLSDESKGVFGDDAKDIFSSLKKIRGHTSKMNGVVHQDDLINNSTITQMRDDAFPFMKFAINSLSID